MFVGGSWFQVAKHITCLPSMHHRYNVLATKFALRSTCLPDDCLLVLLKHSLQHPRLVKVLEQNPVYCSLPDPIPATNARLRSFFRRQWQIQFDTQMANAAAAGRSVLLRACRPCTSKPDLILYLPMLRTSRSRLVRWSLGRFTNMREECPCLSGDCISVIIYWLAEQLITQCSMLFLLLHLVFTRSTMLSISCLPKPPLVLLFFGLPCFNCFMQLIALFTPLQS